MLSSRSCSFFVTACWYFSRSPLTSLVSSAASGGPAGLKTSELKTTRGDKLGKGPGVALFEPGAEPEAKARERGLPNDAELGGVMNALFGGSVFPASERPSWYSAWIEGRLEIELPGL